jgi:hypothetical protein
VLPQVADRSCKEVTVWRQSISTIGLYYRPSVPEVYSLICKRNSSFQKYVSFSFYFHKPFYPSCTCKAARDGVHRLQFEVTFEWGKDQVRTPEQALTGKPPECGLKCGLILLNIERSLVSPMLGNEILDNLLIAKGR